MVHIIKFFSIWLLCCIFCTGNAQIYIIKGSMIDGDSSNALPKATIRYAPAADTAKGNNIAASSTGAFEISLTDTGKYQLTFTYIGYDISRRIVTIKDSLLDLGDVLMFRKAGDATLGTVVVVGKTPPAKQNGDTTELNANAFKVNPDATAEDLLKKAPGITVAADGTVTAQGEQVKKVTIDGREFFGDDAAAALKNLPAEIIDKIQVFDRLSEQATLTGFDDGNSVKALNIVTKANMRNGQFGRIYAGYGTDERYAAGGNVNILTGNKRINLIGLFNNVNQQNFSGEDLLGVTSSSSGGRGNQGGGGRGSQGGGNRGGGSGNFGGGNNFQVGQQPGVSRTNAFGVNFSDLWANKKINFGGSYFFNNSRTATQSITNRQQILGDTSQYYNENKNGVTENFNHRMNFRLEYKIDSSNTLIISPNISYQKNDATSFLDGQTVTELKELINSTSNATRRQSDGYNIRNSIDYRHSFKKRGRAFSINVNNGFNRNSSDIFLNALTTAYGNGILLDDSTNQQTNTLRNGYNVSTNLSYSELIGKKGQLQVNYNPQFTKSKADQENLFFDPTKGGYSIFDTTLSNRFDNTVGAQNGGITYRLGNRDKQISIGTNYQLTVLHSEQQFPVSRTVHQAYKNFLPNAQFRRNFTKQTSLRIDYRTSVNPPSVTQLQNVINNSNILFITTGNPLLDQSYTHNLNARYNHTNTLKGTSFFAGAFGQKTYNYITNATYTATKDSFLAKDVVLRQGSQLSKPVNLDGYYSIRSFLTYGLLLKPIKSTFNINAGFNFVRTPGQVNNILNYSNNYIYNFGSTLASNISEYIDFTLNYSGNYNQVVNTLQPTLNNKYYYHAVGAKINLLSKSGWFLLNDITNQYYNGLAAGYNQNFWLWNASAGKKFFKKKQGEVKLSVFDLLKQNQSVVRNVGDTYIEDVQTQVLQQYFLLTFTYTLRNFGNKAKAAAEPARERRQGGGQRDGGAPPAGL